MDRFLEHPRVAIFENNGEPSVYISSADWMHRNIDERVEVGGCPIYCPKIKQNIIDIITIQLNDNCKARIINSSQNNDYQNKTSNMSVRSQIEIYHYLKEQQMSKVVSFNSNVNKRVIDHA